MADRKKRETCDVCSRRAEDSDGPFVECESCGNRVCPKCIQKDDDGDAVIVCTECVEF
jgi:hypothetical protein